MKITRKGSMSASLCCLSFIVFGAVGFGGASSKLCRDLIPTIEKNAKALTATELEKIQQTMSSPKMLTADVVQTLYSTLRSKPRSAEGKASLTRDGEFRWQKTKSGELFVSNGRDIYFYSPESNSVVKYSAKGGRAVEFENIVTVIMNHKKMKETYHIDPSFRVGEGKTVVSLTPKSTSVDLTHVDVLVDEALGFVEKVCLEYRDPSDSSNEARRVVTYEFSNPTFTRKRAEFFDFVTPKNAKIEVFD